MRLIDSHCHLHDSEFFPETREEAYQKSIEAGVAMVLIGTDERSSREALDYSENHPMTYPVVGIHPHEAAVADIESFKNLVRQNLPVVHGIGEIGLDYFYEHSPKIKQIEVLNEQLQLAMELDLPVSFHIRQAFDDFWPIFANFRGIRGVLHSFTDNSHNLDKALSNGLKIGVNGISTFTKDESQIAMFRQAPLEAILLETDAPFLTPKPFRGRMNIPANVELVARHQADLKGLTLSEVCEITTANARELFKIDL